MSYQDTISSPFGTAYGPGFHTKTITYGGKRKRKSGSKKKLSYQYGGKRKRKAGKKLCGMGIKAAPVRRVQFKRGRGPGITASW